MDSDGPNNQAEVVAFLGDPASYTPPPESVERIETHGALIFLAGDRAIKIKRAVAFHYMDFSTLKKRQKACEREVEINRLTAPAIYRGVLAITREGDGRLAFNGNGLTVEWAIEMARFPQGNVLDRMAVEGRLPVSLMIPLADHIAAYHRAAPVAEGHDTAAGLQRIIAGVTQSLAKVPEILPAGEAKRFGLTIECRLDDARALLHTRAGDGYARRCHGDLHLRNIVLLDGRPTLFDAIEFDEEIATIDVLYDLAFLLMDLWHRDDRQHANAVLNRYLWRCDDVAFLDGLAALPLFLSLRAAIRAMVTIDRLQHVSGRDHKEAVQEIRAYFDLARDFLAPSSARLIAIGGLSGTGKSTLAAGLAPLIGIAPGAFHVRSDVERKSLFGRDPEEALAADAYEEEVTREVYRRINEKAARALAANHSVILDAVFAREGERVAAQQIASGAGVPFNGFWLTASAAHLIERVAARTGDASDADAEVVKMQLQYHLGSIQWEKIDASSAPRSVLSAAARRLNVKC